MRRKPQPAERFHDFLRLKNQSFEQERLLVFHGTSGSGKSANLKFLADHHPGFSEQPVPWIWTYGKRFDASGVQGNRLVAVDEITSLLQFPALGKLLRTNDRVAVASHIHPVWFKILGPALPVRSFSTDDDGSKLRAYLEKKEIPYSEKSLRAFCKLHGASYVDLQCILERFPEKSLDHALSLSLKFDKISVSKRKEWTPVHPILKFD